MNPREQGSRQAPRHTEITRAPSQQRPSTAPSQSQHADAPHTFSQTPQKRKRSRKVVLGTGALIAIAAVAAIAAPLTIGYLNSEARAINKDKYQAVFLSNGDIYFGKITKLNDDYVAIEQIYQLKQDTEVQNSDQEEESQDPEQDGGLFLGKITSDLHAPEDKMQINREHLLFWENITDDGQVVKAIEDSKASE